MSEILFAEDGMPDAIYKYDDCDFEASYLGIKRPDELEYDNERSGNI